SPRRDPREGTAEKKLPGAPSGAPGDLLPTSGQNLQLAVAAPITLHLFWFAALHSFELPAAPGGSKVKPSSLLTRSWLWQFPSSGWHTEPSPQALATSQAVVPSLAHVPVWHPPGPFLPPLFRQSRWLMQAVRSAFVLAGFAHFASHWLKIDA